MSLYASNMTCYCVNLSYDEFVERISEDVEKYLTKLKDYAGNYLYFENPNDIKEFPDKIHHDLVIVNDRGELTRIGANLYIDKDNNNKTGFFEYDSRTHEVKIDRTKIREINGNLTIGKYKSIKVENRDVTVDGKTVRILSDSNNIISNKSNNVMVGVSPDKIYLGDVCVKDMLDKEKELDKRTSSLITELNAWPKAVMNLVPVRSSLVSVITAFAQNNIDAKFLFSVTPAGTNTQQTSTLEILNIPSMYHLYMDVLKSTNIFYIYVNAELSDTSEKYVNFFISPMYYNYIYIDDKYDNTKEYMNDATSVNSEFSTDNNIYYKYTVKCPGQDDSSPSSIVLNTLYNECTKDTVDRDKVRLVQDILSEYNENNLGADFRGLSVAFKFRHVGYINVKSEISTTIVPGVYSYIVGNKGVSKRKIKLNFFTGANNSSEPKVNNSDVMAGSKNNLPFLKYVAGNNSGTGIYNIGINDYDTNNDFLECNNTRELLGRINRVFATYAQTSTQDYNKYYYSSQKEIYKQAEGADTITYVTNEEFYKAGETEGTFVKIPVGSEVERGVELYSKQHGDYVLVGKVGTTADLKVTLLSHLEKPEVTTWNYKYDYIVELEYNKLSANTTVHQWYKNIIQKPISGVAAYNKEEHNTAKLQKFELSQAELNRINVLPIDYTKIFRYRLDNDIEWSNWMCFNNASIRINEDTKKLTIQVPSVGWTGNLGASGVFLLSDLYRKMGSNKSIASSTFGDNSLDVDISSGDNQKIFNWIKQSFKDAVNVFELPKISKPEAQNYSMVEAITVKDVSYPGLLFSNALFMNIRSRMSNPDWTEDGINKTLTDFFTFKNDTEENTDTNASTNFYLTEYTIPLKDYPITNKPTTLNFKYVSIAMHNNRYVYNIKEQAEASMKDMAEASETSAVAKDEISYV